LPLLKFQPSYVTSTNQSKVYSNKQYHTHWASTSGTHSFDTCWYRWSVDSKMANHLKEETGWEQYVSKAAPVLNSAARHLDTWRNRCTTSCNLNYSWIWSHTLYRRGN